LLSGEESNAYSTFSSTAGTSSTMNVCINFFWWFKLNNQINFGNVQSSCGNISSYQTLQFSLFEAIKSYLPLFLGNIAMQNLGFLLQVGLKSYIIGFSFGLTKNDSPSMPSSIQIDNVCDNGIPMGERATQREMLNSF
jgi:hypothetical protein